MAKIIAVSTNKGGVLKTSITTNLAGLFAKEGKKVLIVDTDNQGNSALTFGADADELEKTTYDVLVNGIHPSEAIINLYENIDLLPSNDDMSMFEFDVLLNADKYENVFMLLKNALEKIKDQYDVILIDSPPNLGLNTGNVLTAAEQVLIPFQPETYSMRSLMKILDVIQKFKESYNPNLQVLGVVATLVRSYTTLHSDVMKQSRQYTQELGIKMFDVVIPHSVKGAATVYDEALPTVLSLKSNHSDYHKLVAAYEELYKEIKEQQGVLSWA
jgi:chromosome partitioning protein